MLVPAFYFDGRSSRKHAVCLKVDDGVAVVSGDFERRCPITELRVSEKLHSAARKVTFPDGAYLEILDSHSFETLLRATGHQESLASRMQQSWRAVLASLAATVLILFAGYHFGLPLFARGLAAVVPEQAEQTLGREALALLDRRILAPTELPAATRTAIRSRMAVLVTPEQQPAAAELVFRKSRIGPNAFALPSGQIVLTDELVQKLERDDDQIVAVLAHELGHLRQRHLLRRLIQGSVTAAVATLLFGDASAVLANLPTLMLDLKYSRDAEREADDYALEMLKLNGIGANAMASALEALDQNPNKNLDYLSTHPQTAERIARINGR
jgi:Zn-dependent protease with chaperone function